MEILIAEDDPSSRMLLQATLAKWNHSIVATNDGFEAWEALQKDDVPPMAILDWMMPGIDGVQVCRSIKQDSATAHAHVVAMTGHYTDIVEQRVLAAGAAVLL